MSRTRATLAIATLALTACSMNDDSREVDTPRWLAGDHHIHSRYSVGYDRDNLPAYAIGGDAIYPISMNASMAREFGLSWTVATDHGGPLHSKINAEQAYPELQQSRAALPDVIQFYGMELNTPAADHSSLIIPFTRDEKDRLLELESRFDRYEPWPPDPTRNAESHMLDALRTMDRFAEKPVVIANHPSRSAPGPGEYGLDEPAELRRWNETAPGVAVGMAGAPGHQAAGIGNRQVARGAYRVFPTMGGFDQMTARVGGFWDSMLAERRHWWITANSDSHKHHTEGGLDFWPGEFSKTYVFARKDHASILESLRSGKIFVTTGDLVSELYVQVDSDSGRAEIGGELEVNAGEPITISIRVRDPDSNNHHAENPAVSRVDLIVGRITGPAGDPSTDTNPSTQVVRRFTAAEWHKRGEFLEMVQTLVVDTPIYIRVRGTNTDQLEPEPDTPGEDPWQDLWFYSNPVFVGVAE